LNTANTGMTYGHTVPGAVDLATSGSDGHNGTLVAVRTKNSSCP